MRVIVHINGDKDVSDPEFEQIVKELPWPLRKYLQEKIQDQVRQYENTGKFVLPGVVSIVNASYKRKELEDRYHKLQGEIDHIKNYLLHR